MADVGKTVGILQPGYFPWLGFFEQLARCDVFVLYDDVQFEKGSWRNRNRIKTPSGPQWITVPVLCKNKGFPRINEVVINPEEKWATRHVRTLTQNYRKAPHFKTYADELFAVLESDWEKLLDLNLAVIQLLARWLDISTPMLLASNLNIGGANVERLMAIIKHLGGDIFYEGSAGRNYIDTDDFAARDIRVVYQDYAHPCYPQLYGGFISHLSIIDLLFNCGSESLNILLSTEAKRNLK